MSSKPLRGFLTRRLALYLAGALSLAAVLQYSITPRIEFIGEGGRLMTVNQGTDALVISEPFSDKDLIDLYRNKKGELLEISFSHADFSGKTSEGLSTTRGLAPPPDDYGGDIAYRLSPESGERSRCRITIGISPANTAKPIANLFFSLADATAEKRVFDLRTQGGRILVTVQYNRGCGKIWLNAGEWQREIRAPIGHGILVDDGSNIEFTLFRPAADGEQVAAQTSGSDWSVELLPGDQKFRQIEVRSVRQGTGGKDSHALRIQAVADEEYLKFRGMKIGLGKLDFEIYEHQPTPGSKTLLRGPRIGNGGSRSNYLKAHPLWAATFLAFLVVPLLLIIGAVWPRIVELWAFCASIAHKLSARFFLRGPYSLQYWTDRRNYFLEKQALVTPGVEDFVFRKEVERAEAAIEKIKRSNRHRQLKQ
jgi:hypothetical protein